MPTENQEMIPEAPQKSSMEILSELFGSFDAEPPVIVKKEKSDEKKHKKSKKKHKCKEKKHKKKSKKRKRSTSSSSDSSAVDLTDILIKKENSDDGQLNLENLLKQEEDLKKEITEKFEIDKNNEDCGSIYDAAILAIKEEQKVKTEKSDFRKEKKKEKHKRKRHRSKSTEHKKVKRSRSKSREKHAKTKSRSPESHKKDTNRHISKDQDKDLKHHDDFKRGKEEYIYDKRDRSRSRSRDDRRDREHVGRDREYRTKETKDWRDRESDNKRKHKDSSYKSEPSWYDKEDKWTTKDRYRNYSDRDRDKEKRSRCKSEEESTHIDKKKLLEIARKNAIQMMKSGSLPGALTLGPQAQEKVIAAIKSGGKTVEELTDFCKTLSKKEELGELSSISDENDTDTDSEMQFHHPFLIKERPISITMNIKNSIPLPIKNSQERASELRIQFPVSSGQQHRKTESEWVPVSPKKTETPLPVVALPSVAPAPSVKHTQSKSITAPVTTAAITAPPAAVQVFPLTANLEQSIDIAAIVSQRLSAMRKLQENPNDVQALTSMYKAQKEMNSWAESKQQIGQFTGSTGAQILSQAELSSGYQAWARKDQLQTAAPVSGGMGMHLLQKMGWKPGEGLGKEKSGTLEPLLLEVKLDKKGIVAKEEQKRKVAKLQKGVAAKASSMQGKHPVSLLGEYACKNKLGVPQYELCFECGPDHKKNFLFRVILNNMEYKPQIASPNKKEAKANAALVCLQQLGILPMPATQQGEQPVS